MLYSDLDKKSRGGFIIEDALVLNEVFDTALNIRRGQIFYGRGYGLDFEQYLLKLNESNTLIGLQGELYRLRNMDGRLNVDPSQTKIYTEKDDQQTLLIQGMLDIKGLPQISVAGMILDDNEKYATLDDIIDSTESPWTKSEIGNTIGLTSNTTAKLKLRNGKTINVVNGKLDSIS